MEFKILNNMISKIENMEIFVSENIKDLSNEFNKYTSIIDARSLAFFSIGVNNINYSGKNICFIVSSDELSSILTAVTEAKYQQQKVIIISIGNEVYMDSFIDVTEEIITSDNIEQINKKMEEYIEVMHFKPLLINIKIDVNIEKNKQYQGILEKLLNKIKDNEKICTNITNNIINDKIISWNNDYGIVSRYLGYLSANKNNKVYLFTNYNSLYKDINAFYTRYIDKKVIIFCIKDKNTIMKNDFARWSKENNIKFIETQAIDNINLDNFDRQAIIIEISI